VGLTGGNRNDITQLLPLIQAIPPLRDRRVAADDATRAVG
jgi:hypothetical protein